MNKTFGLIKMTLFIVSLITIASMIVNSTRIAWALDIKKMTKPEAFKEYIDGSNGLKWGADEVIGSGKIADIPITFQEEVGLWTNYYETKDGCLLYFALGEFYAYIKLNNADNEVKKIEEMFGEGQPINEVDRKWDLDSILIIYNKYQDGSSAITCINKELDNKISKYRPSKKLLFSIIKNQIFEKYVNLPTSIDDDIFIYDQYSYMYRFIPYVLKNSYGFNNIGKIVSRCYLGNRLKGTEADQACLTGEIICHINLANIKLYRNKNESVDYYHQVIQEKVEYLNSLGPSGQKAIELIDEYNKFVEKTFKEKEEEENIEIASKNKQSEDHAASIKSGKKPIQNLEDAAIYYNAREDMSIVTKPPLKPDNKHYLVRGIVDGKENTYYRVKYESYNDLHYFMFRLSKTLSSPNFRVGSGIRIVGKLIRVDPYTTVAGAEKYMCIFEAVGIE